MIAIELIEKGGIVVAWIFALSFFASTIIFSKFWFYFVDCKKTIKDLSSNKINKQAMITSYKYQLFSGFSILNISIAVSPLLGLLGTVVGMIEVFEVISIFGNSEPKMMASGISKATIPTMTGITVSLMILLFKASLTRLAHKRLFELQEVL